jgi:DNA ligase-associated metallophosphoesterase
MEAARITLNGVKLDLLPEGALYWPGRKLLAVADLHLEKASFFARRGQFLPPYDSRATLDRLERLLARLPVDQVICLGDSFHDDEARERIDGESALRLADLTKSYDWIWIVGNHDPDPRGAWGGRIEEELSQGALVFRHEAETGRVAGEISGHYHPKAAIRVRGRKMLFRAFLEDGKRLILPAFGSLTGGLDALDPAYAPLFRNGFRVHLLGRTKVASLTAEALA